MELRGLSCAQRGVGEGSVQIPGDKFFLLGNSILAGKGLLGPWSGGQSCTWLLLGLHPPRSDRSSATYIPVRPSPRSRQCPLSPCSTSSPTFLTDWTLGGWTVNQRSASGCCCPNRMDRAIGSVPLPGGIVLRRVETTRHADWTGKIQAGKNHLGAEWQ